MDTAQSTSATKYLNDWVIDQQNSSIVCSTYYCTFTCKMTRNYSTSDIATDVQYTKGSTYYAYGGYKVYDSPTTAANSWG